MKRQQRLSWMSLSPKRALAVAAPVLAVVVSVFVAVVALPGCATESNGGFQRGGPGTMTQTPWPGVYEIITRLELEPEQLPVVRAVLEEAEDAREELRGEMVAGTAGRPDPSMMTSMRERMDELNESTKDRLSELLTVEQMAEYEEIAREAEREMDATRSRRGGMRGDPGGVGGKGGR